MATFVFIKNIVSPEFNLNIGPECGATFLKKIVTGKEVMRIFTQTNAQFF